MRRFIPNAVAPHIDVKLISPKSPVAFAFLLTLIGTSLISRSWLHVVDFSSQHGHVTKNSPRICSSHVLSEFFKSFNSRSLLSLRENTIVGKRGIRALVEKQLWVRLAHVLRFLMPLE